MEILDSGLQTSPRQIGFGFKVGQLTNLVVPVPGTVPMFFNLEEVFFISMLQKIKCVDKVLF